MAPELLLILRLLLGKDIGQAVVFVNEATEGGGMISFNVARGHWKQGDIRRGILFQRIEHGGDLFGACGLVVSDELCLRGVVQRQIEGESRVVEESIRWMCAFRQPLKLLKHCLVSESGSADG